MADATPAPVHLNSALFVGSGLFDGPDLFDGPYAPFVGSGLFDGPSLLVGHRALFDGPSLLVGHRALFVGQLPRPASGPARFRLPNGAMLFVPVSQQERD